MAEQYLGNVAEVESLDNVSNLIVESTNNGIKKIPTETLKEGIYKDLPIDSEFSDTSENAVKNKVIYKALKDKADVIINSASGTTVAITDCAAVPPINIKLFGKGKQRQYEGNQLFDLANSNGFVSVYSGLSTEIDIENNTLTTTNTHTTDRTGNLDLGILPAGTYYLSFENVNGYIASPTISYGELETGLTRITSIQNTGGSFTIEEELHCWIVYTLKNDNPLKLKNIMLNKGTTALPCEPFVGGEQSPSMNYPQSVESHGDSGSIASKLFGGNIIPPTTNESETVNGVTFDVLEDGTVHVYGTATDNASFLYVGGWKQQTGINIPRGFEISSAVNGITVNMYGFDDEGSYGHIKSTENSSYSDITISIDIGNGTTIDNNVRPYACKDEIVTDYVEPQPFTFQTPNGLRGIPLGQTIPDAIKNSPIHMNGVYWDSVEQQYYISDTKNENGKDVQRIYERTITDFYLGSVTDGIAQFNAGIQDYRMLFNGKENYNILSNYAIGKLAYFSEKNVCYITDAGNNDFVRLFTDANISVEELNAKNFTLAYILKEPIVTESDVQYDVVMNYPNTTIVNDEGAYQEVTYIADTKNYIAKIEKKHEEDIQTLKNAILSLGGNV